MPSHICDPHRMVSGKIECDLLRPDREKTMYSAQFKVLLCPICGRTEFYCESHLAVCEWLRGATPDNG
jgi:hypothetical protein